VKALVRLSFVGKGSGLYGSIFEIWKFRSMYAEHPDPDAARQTSKDDPRVTRVGRVIRRSRIDDLPQLLNVIQGRMSVVGQRAHALDTRVEGRLLEVLLEGYAARHRGKLGITGSDQRIARRTRFG
jgi:polysaccharide biosynthesis protein PslA